MEPASRPDFDEGRRLMGLALADPRPATAVFAHNDGMAMGAVRALREGGLPVPDPTPPIPAELVVRASAGPPPGRPGGR